MMQNISIVAVVVTYNRCAMLQRCLSHLEAQTYPCDILVIDNASEDETNTWLTECQKKSPQMKRQRLEKNVGGAGGFNRGILEGVKSGYSHIWLMDDDCLPEPDALEKLMEAERLLGDAEQYGFLSSAVLWMDGRECKMNRQKIKKSYYERVEMLKHGMVQVEQSTFVSLLIPTRTVMEVGLPIKEFFIWGDDIEYTRRIAVRNGRPCYMAGQSRVVHAMQLNGGSSIAADKPDRIARYNYAFRNENYLYRQEGLRGFAYYTAKCGLNLLRVIRFAENHRLRRCAIIVKQYILGLFFNPKVEYVKTEGYES